MSTTCSVNDAQKLLQNAAEKTKLTTCSYGDAQQLPQNAAGKIVTLDDLP